MTLILLNIYDAFVTLALINKDLATESNPIMRAALHHGPATFLAVKILVVTALAVVLLWAKDKSPLAKRALLALTLVYIGIAILHCKSLLLLAQ